MDEGVFNLADDLFLVLLDDQTGRHIAHPDAVAVALAGALLAELIAHGVVAVVDDRLKSVASPPSDRALRYLAELIEAEPQHSLATWVEFTAASVTATVAERLHDAGRVFWTRATRGRLRSVPDTYMPMHRNGVVWRAARLTNLLQRGQIASVYDGLLVGFCDAIGFLAYLWRDAREPNIDHRDWTLQRMALLRPDLHQLITCVAAATGAKTFRLR